MGERFIELLPQLPHNSPLRRPLLQKLVQGLHINEITSTLNISKRTYFRLLSDEGNLCLDMRYTPGVKRQRIENDQLTVAGPFLDENFPMTSGRDFRVIKMIDENIYAIYYFYCLERDLVPLGKTYFFYTFLKEYKIHRSEDESICCHCHELKKLKNKQNPTNSEKEKIKKLEDGINNRVFI